MKARVWLVAVATPCAALALVLFGWPEPASVAPPIADAHPPTPELSGGDHDPAAHVARESAVAAPPPAQSRPPVPVAVAWQTSASPLPGQAAPGPMTQLILDAQREPPSGLAANERLFDAESIDVEWAPMAEAEILDRFAQQTGIRLVDLRVDCRTTLCRVQMTQPRPSEETVQPLRFLTSLGYRARFVVALGNQAGGIGTIAYLMRPGTEPPALMPPFPAATAEAAPRR